MSFLRRLSRTKSADTQDQENSDKDKEKVKRKSYSGTLPAGICKDDKTYVTERKLSLKDKKKSKSESDGDKKGSNSVDKRYPLFYVHYLGRVPTKLEYGHEAIEGPVDQLCILREKEKLPKLVLTFNIDGLFFREITGPFNRVKKDGMFIYIPLHMVTYGVGSVAHPNVFACVTRTAFDKKCKEMFIVHAFLCDKSSVAQKMTYWQLQAYIEAYESLKRKKEMRMQRRLRNSMKADNLSIKTSTTSVSLSVSSQEGSTTSRDSERQKIGESTFINPKQTNQHEDDEKSLTENKTNKQRKKVEKTASNSSAVDELRHSNPERHSATSIDSKSSKDSALGDELNSEQSNDNSSEIPVTELGDPFSFGNAVTPAAPTSSVDQSDGRKGSGLHDDNLDTISIVTMPIDAESVPRDLAFEKRISELNKLMEVDAEDLKTKLIKENPTLVRRLYYGTIDRHGVFHRQGLNLGLDSDNSYA